MNERTLRKRNWLKWLVVFVIVLFVAGSAGWFALQLIVKSGIESQLATIGIGTPEIGRVSISMSGIRASDIKFHQSDNLGETPTSLDALVIHHSLLELISGNPTYDAIDLIGLQVSVDVTDVDNQPIPGLDLKSLVLPARKISISQSAIIFHSGPDRTFDIREIDLSVTSEGGKLQTDGVIASMIGGPWKVNGEVDPAAERLNIDLSTDELVLVNHRWQKWPFIPPVIEQTVHGDAQLKATVSITATRESGFDVEGYANIDSLNLRFPWFDNLPVNIYQGDIEFRNQTVYYKELYATVDGADQLHGNGQTTVDQFPIKVSFDGDFRDIDLKSLRKLVAGIPEDVQGKAAGKVQGSVDVERSTRSIVNISADADCFQSSYAQIKTEPLETETRIIDLVFDEHQAFESMEGHVSVNGTTIAQPINNIFSTFELVELQRRLELDGDFVADVKLQVPLGTITDLTTWQLNVDGHVAEGTVCGQAISNVNVETALKAGELHFRPIRVTPLSVAESSRFIREQMALPSLDIAVEWPLLELESDDGTAGRVWAKGDRVPTAWFRRFIDRQIENATRLTREEIDPQQIWAFDMAGQIDFETLLNIPTQSPDHLGLWNGNGTVSGSVVIFDRLAINDLSATLALDRGRLSIGNASGLLESGGQITADGHIDIWQQRDHQIEFTGRGLPFSSMASLAGKFSENVQKSFEMADVDAAIDRGELTGELSMDLKLTTQPENDQIPWTIQSRIFSDRLGFGDESVSNINIEGNGNPKRVHFETVHADLADDGFIDAQGEWLLDAATGSGSIGWEKLPIEWIWRLAGQKEFLPVGRTNGNLVVNAGNDPNDDDAEKIPIEIEGRVSVDPLRMGWIEVPPFSFEVATRNEVVHFENVYTTGERVELDVRAQVALASPYPFSIAGNLENMRLADVFQSAMASGNVANAPNLNGIITTNFFLDGQLQPPDWQTRGELSLSELSINGRRVNDISALWNHVNSDWERSTFSAQVLGGTIRLTKLESDPEYLQLEIADLDLQQLESATGLQQEVAGALNGTASLSKWSRSDEMQASVELACPAIPVEQIVVRDFTGRASLENRELSYNFDAIALNGRLSGTGQTDLNQFNLDGWSLPLEFRATNISLQKLSSESRAFRPIQSIAGSLSAIGTFNFSFSQPAEGSGRIEFQDVIWKHQRFVKNGSTRFAINNGIVALDDIRGDLDQGSISGRVVLPINRNTAGTYEFEVRQMHLGELTGLALGKSTPVKGELNARIRGRLGRQVYGQGYVDVQRASIRGLAGQSFQLPVRISLTPQDLSGSIEVLPSTFRLFDGKATASGTIHFGPLLSVNTDIRFANVDTGKLLRAIADLKQSSQGKMSGQLLLNGPGIRTAHDLSGSFTGKLTRSSAFELPVIQDISRFIAGTNINTPDYVSDDISIRLNKGRIEVKQLNFTNPLAKISVRGDAFLDGRLDLQVAAHVDQLGQPTLIEELAGSPLASLSGSPALFLTRAAEFLSERVVFLRISGTFRRPQIRPDSGKQISDEVIRYFLRGSQILPNSWRRND